LAFDFFAPRCPSRRARRLLFLFFLTFFVLAFTTETEGGARLPDPENVALAGAPYIAGCGEGAARHESAVVHDGGETTDTGHGTAAEQTCASYTSYALSKSWGANCAVVRKKTSSTLSLASRNTDSSADVPDEIKPTQPPDASLNVALEVKQLPIPAGSYSYTSSVPFVS
jgi:hypothetical protein